jgi:hypothetical protein
LKRFDNDPTPGHTDTENCTMNRSNLHPSSHGLASSALRDSVQRRRSPSGTLHRLGLLLALALGGGALVYNAVSIVNGDGGLAGLSMPFDAPSFSAVAKRFGG